MTINKTFAKEAVTVSSIALIMGIILMYVGQEVLAHILASAHYDFGLGLN